MHTPTINISKLRETKAPIRISGFIEYKNRGNTSLKNLILRQQNHSIFCIIPEDNEELQNLFNTLTLESFITITGKLKTEQSDKSTTKNFKFYAYKIYIQGVADKKLPFLLKDINMPITSNQLVKYEKCLNNRALYLRSYPANAIFRILDNTLYSFRSFLKKRKFIEITTPKLISGASEGGSNVFEVKFFKKTAYLAQSPQLYKQMAIIGGLGKVYEIGHVYRQEESNINKYLSEFTGLDFEMEIEKDYFSLINYVHKLLNTIVYHIRKSTSLEYEEIKRFRPFVDIRIGKKPVVITHKKCVEMLRSVGFKLEDLCDFSREQEKKLGEMVAEEYKVDLFCIRDYPTEVRAFYSKPHPKGPYCYSYDFLLRGEEICSGAERINNPTELIEQLNKRGIDPLHLQSYIEAFKFGAPRHGGVGIGLERFLKSLFNFDDIRYFNMFPRDPKRLIP